MKIVRSFQRRDEQRKQTESRKARLIYSEARGPALPELGSIVPCGIRGSLDRVILIPSLAGGFNQLSVPPKTAKSPEDPDPERLANVLSFGNT